MIRFLFVVVREEPCVDGDERGGERPFAEDVLQKVRDAQGDVEGVAHVGRPEVVSLHALAHQADDAAQQDARHDEESVPVCARFLTRTRRGALRGGELARRSAYLL